MAANPMDWIDVSDKVVGANHPSLPDVANRPLRQVLESSGMDVDNDGFTGLMPVFNVKAYGALGTGIDDDTAAIQACIDAAPPDSTIYFPRSPYLITATANQCLLVDKPLRFVGEGWGSELRVKATTPNTVDAIRIVGGYGGTQMVGLYMGYLNIQPQSGNPGRHCINVDVTPGAIAYAVFDYMRLGALSDYSFKCTNPLPRTDGFYTSTIQDCLIAGGINLDNAGDSIHLYRNTCFSLAGNPNQLGIRVNLIPGALAGSAQGFELIGGNITCAGGIEYVCGNQGVIAHVNMEAAWPSTNAARALINISGTVANPVYGLTIRDCLFGAGNTNIDTIVQFDYAVGTKCEHNTLGPPIPPRLVYKITSNANGTRISDDTWGVPGGGLPETFILDEGLGTVISCSTSLATHTYNQSAYYLAQKAAQHVSQIIEFGRRQYAESVVFAVSRNNPKAPLAALVTAPGLLSVGGYRYAVAYVVAGVERAHGTISSLCYVSTPGTIGKIQLTGIPIGPAGTTARVLYRMKADGTQLFALETIADNVTVTYLDNIADSALGAAYNPMDASGPKPTCGLSYGELATLGILRVFATGNVRFGDGTDNGTPIQFNDFAFFGAGASFSGDISLSVAKRLLSVDSAGTAIPIVAFNIGGDNTTHVGAQAVPASGGNTVLYHANTEKARTTSTGFKVLTGFGCNGTNPQSAVTVAAAATDLPTALTLLNQLRALLIANGQAV